VEALLARARDAIRLRDALAFSQDFLALLGAGDFQMACWQRGDNSNTRNLLDCVGELLHE
jgi:hypothetical protein